MINNIGLIEKDNLEVKYLLSRTTNSNIIDYYKSTNKARILSNNSPKNICIKEKKSFERMINLLDMNADTLIHTNNCVYSKFYNAYEEILKDLGFKFRIISISDIKYSNMYKIYNKIKEINSKLNVFNYTYYFIKTMYLKNKVSKINKIIKENIGFEVNKGEYISIYKFFIQEIIKSKSIKGTYIKYINKLKKVKVLKNIKYEVGILGYDSYEVSNVLAQNNIATKYSKYKDDIKRCKYYIKECNYIIYIRKEGCIKEVLTFRNIKNICKKHNKKLIYIDDLNKLGGVIL